MKTDEYTESDLRFWLTKIVAHKKTITGALVTCREDDPDAICWTIPYVGSWGSLSSKFNSLHDAKDATALMRYAYEKGYENAKSDIRKVLGVGR